MNSAGPKTIKPIDRPDHISILVPTRSRPKYLKNFFDSLEETTRDKKSIDLWIYVDNDDVITRTLVDTNFHKGYTFKTTWIFGERTKSQGAMINILWKKCTTNPGLYLPAPDDYLLITKNWDDVVREAFNRYHGRIMLGYISDQIAAPEQVVLAILSAEWTNVLGRVLTEYFPFWYDDAWLDQVSQMVQRKVRLDMRMEAQGGKGKTPRMRNLLFWHKFFIHTMDDRIEEANLFRKIIYSEDSKAYRESLEAGNKLIKRFIDEIESIREDDIISMETNLSDTGGRQKSSRGDLYSIIEMDAVKHLCEKVAQLISRRDIRKALTLLDNVLYASHPIKDIQYFRAVCLKHLGRLAEAEAAAAVELGLQPGDLKTLHLCEEIRLLQRRARSFSPTSRDGDESETGAEVASKTPLTMAVREPEARGESAVTIEDRDSFESMPGFTVETMLSGNHAESLLQLIGLIGEGGQRPVRMLEIGVAEGQNSYSILTNTSSNVTVYGVDPYKAYEGDAFFAKFSPSMFEDFYTEGRSKFEQFRGRAFLIRKTSEEAAQDFEDGFFDLIFIDANHTYESVRKDIALWRRKVRPGGILAGDDFDEHRFGGVIRAVNEAFPQSFCLAPGSVWFRLMEDVKRSKVLRHKLNQEKAQGLYEAATRLFRSGGYATALELFDAATSISPDLSDFHYRQALCLIKLGQRERALRALQKELSQRPEHAEAQELLRQLLPGESRSESSGPAHRAPLLSASRNGQRLRILLVYNRVAHHMAELVNVALRKRFPQVHVFGCGPNNEFDIPDEPDSHKRIAALVGQLDIDVLWELESGYVSTDFQFKRTAGPIPALKMWWVHDSHQFLDLMVQKAPYFDQMFVLMKDDVAAFGPRAIWLPGAASVDVAIDYHLPRVHDLTFVGTLDAVHRNRVEMIKKLLQVFPQMNIKQNLFLEGMARELSTSKIVFNMSLSRDLNYRVFETLACGALLMTDRIENGLLDLFEHGKHLVVYDSFDDLKEKIRYYLAHDEERKAIARAGQQKVLQEHTVDHRIRQVLGMLPGLLTAQGRPVPSSLINGACPEIYAL